MTFQRMLRIAQARCLVALLFLILPMVAMAVEVWVITDQHHSVQGTPNRLIELDRTSHLEEALSSDLPNDPQQAAATVQRRLKEGGSALQQRLASAYQDVVDAWSLGITTLPAVVVDQRYVVYGETDLDRAIACIERHRKEQP